MLLVLTLIAVIAGGALAYVNSVTEQQIKNINETNLKTGINKVLQVEQGVSLDLKIDTLYFKGKEHKDANIQFITYRSEKGTAVSSTDKNGFGGPLTVLVGFDENGCIKGYTILHHSETPGLGAKAGEWFQDKIIGRNPGERKLQVSKATNDKNDVDAITASTITSNAFLRAIQNAYDKVIANKQDATSGASAKAKSCKSECDACCDSTDCDSINK